MTAYRWTGTALEPVEWTERTHKKLGLGEPQPAADFDAPMADRVRYEEDVFERHYIEPGDRAVYVIAGQPVTQAILDAVEAMEREKARSSTREERAGPADRIAEG